jgi:hypothetical protein
MNNKHHHDPSTGAAFRKKYLECSVDYEMSIRRKLKGT